VKPSAGRFRITVGFLQFSGVVLAILYAAACQNNGAAYLLAFMLMGLFCVGVVRAGRNLSGVSARTIGASDAFARAPAAASPFAAHGGTDFVEVRVAVHNTASANRYAFSVSLPEFRRDDPDKKRAVLGIPIAKPPDDPDTCIPVLPPGDMREATVRIEGLPRGYYRIGKVDVASVYPFGFAQLVSRFPVEPREFWVYPAPIGSAELPVSFHAPTGSGGAGRGGEDFVGVRTHQPGESHRHVDWKAVSRGAPMMVKQFGGGAERTLVLDWDALDGDTEARLSALCFWVLHLEQEGDNYALKLPDRQTPPGSGSQHMRSLLRLLAGFAAPTEKNGREGL